MQCVEKGALISTEGQKPLGNRWVFKKKVKMVRSVQYKAHLMVKGYMQIPGMNLTDSFAPVATEPAMRTVCTLVLYSQKDIPEESCTHEVVDVEAVFLEDEVDTQNKY